MMHPAILGGRPAFAPRLTTMAGLPPFSCLAEEIRSVIESDQLTGGRWVEAFEQAAAERLGVRHAIAVSNCTVGLILTFACLDLAGEVILPSFTFCATGHAATWNRLKLVFADSRARTMNIDPDSVRSLVSEDTAAIVGVHAFGAPCELGELSAVADRHGVPLVIDAAHAFGSTWQGQSVGWQAMAHVFSFSPGNLLVSGEGGMVTTNDDQLALRLRVARNDGHSGDFNCVTCGLNARMPELSALLAVVGLRQFSSQLARRQAMAAACREELSRVPGLDIQGLLPGDTSTHRDLVIAVEPEEFGLDRDQLAEALSADGVETSRPFCPPLHLQQVYRGQDTACLPIAESLANRTLALPLAARMTADDVERMLTTIQVIHDHACDVRQALESKADRLGGSGYGVSATLSAV